MTDTDLIEKLNELIETSKDGEKGFEACAADASDGGLKAFFLEGAQRCAQAATELLQLVISIGGDPQTSGSLSGTVHRGWFTLKSVLSPRENLALLDECERGEDYAKARYQAVVDDPSLPEPVREVVQRQYQGVLMNHDRVKELRDTLRRSR